MENARGEQPSADAVAERGNDQRAPVPATPRPGGWPHLAFAGLAAITVWAPATGSVGRFTVVVALCTVGLTTLERLRERTTPAARPQPTGRRGWAILTVVGVVFIALLATSFAFVVAGRPELTLLCSAVTFAAMLVGALWYDRASTHG